MSEAARSGQVVPELQGAGGSPRTKKQEFEIHARSCTLVANPASPNDVLWRPATCYRIPIFQRPYSWQDAEVHRLVNDLLAAYFGRNGRVPQEPTFIGTMQLMVAESVNQDCFTRCHDVIDGQQRITTLILILRALELIAPADTIWQTLDYRRRLTTAVSGTIQQTYLQEALDGSYVDEDESEAELNAYRRNLRTISAMLAEDDQFCREQEAAKGFAAYLISRVYFVIIETRASLSKTLQIFDAINTSGMDLNGGDIFKIRFYEFLRERKSAPESIFDEVCGLYERIDQGNKDRKREAVTMEDVLSLAQQILITDHGLSVDTRNLAGTTFFERLFDVILNIQQHQNFQKDKCDSVELPLEFFRELITISFEWEDTIPELEPEVRGMTWFIWWSRYGRYHYLIHYFLHRFRSGTTGPAASRAELGEFIISLSKLLLIYSLCFQKITNEGRHKMRELMAVLCRDKTATTPQDVIAHLAEARTAMAPAILKVLLEDPFAYIPKAKNLVCRLDAMLAELAAGTPAERLTALIFDERIDIEHIESFNHEDCDKRASIQDLWRSELHQLGNLIVLEYDLNRSISNYNYGSVKRPRYEAESKFRAVQEFARAYPLWTKDHACKRRETLAKVLADYLCGPPFKISEGPAASPTTETAMPSMLP
jgi:hypothetical protein